MNRNSKHVYSTNKRFLKLAGNNDVKSQFNMPLPVYIYDHVYGATKANPNGASPIRGTPTALPITGYNAISPDAIKTTAGSYTNTGQNVSSNVYATSVPGKQQPITAGMTMSPYTYYSNKENAYYNNWQYCHQQVPNVTRCVYNGLQHTRHNTTNTLNMPTNIIERNVTAYGATNQGTTPVTTLRPMLTQTFVANSPPKALPESGVNTATLLQREQNKCINAIPTTNYIKTQEIKQNPAHNSVNAYGIDNNIALENEPIQEQEETEYPHLALDLSKITNAYPKFEQTPKLKQHERHNITQTKETAPEARVAIGKPRHPYTAQFNDPVEKELEKWHNSHTSTIKWVRIKRGVYTADNQEVKLVKLNGGLYVKGAKNHSKLDHLPIDKFVQKVQNNIVS